MQFRDVIGQGAVKRRLIQSAKEGRVSHAQLFLGQPGFGPLPLAIAYAQYLACQNPGPEDSCGECPSCLKYGKLAHPDLHFVFPVNTTKSVSKNPVSSRFLDSWREAMTSQPYQNLFQWLEYIGIENKQGNISVLESQEILRALALKPFEDGYKVMIIWMPERMHPSASNKLLKILEEPPERTLFLLVAQSQEQMLTTILSRTQIVQVPRIDAADLGPALVERYSLDPARATSVAHLSEGDFLEAAHHVKESEDESFNRTHFVQWMRWCYSYEVLKVLPWVDEMARLGRERQKNFLAYGLHMFRECLVHNFADTSLIRLEGAELQWASKFAAVINGANAAPLITEFNECIAHIERNGNAKILFLDLSLRTMQLLRKKP